MATKPKSRIRWTEEEANAVIGAARALGANGVKLSSEQRLAKAQEVLPKARRRPFSANLSSWLNKSARGNPAGLGRGKTSGSRASSAVIGVASGAAAQAMIAIGTAVVRGILSDKGVQKALKAALR